METSVPGQPFKVQSVSPLPVWVGMATRRTAVISHLNKFGLGTSGQLLLALSARSLASSYFAHHRGGAGGRGWLAELLLVPMPEEGIE